MLSVVLWKWHNNVGWIDYKADNVNHLANQIDKYIGVPHKIFCITDDPKGLHPNLTVIPIEEFTGAVPVYSDSKHLRSCYRRLKLLSKEAEKFFGKRIMQLDIDMVITDDISNIAKRTEPFIIWRSFSHGHRSKYRNFALNTSLYITDAGARSHIWETFSADPEGIAKAAAKNYWVGTDQAIIGYLAYKTDTDPPTFNKTDGIYSFRDDPEQCRGQELGAGVKVISFHDRFDPADIKLQRDCRWLANAWKDSADYDPVLQVGKVSAPAGERPLPDAGAQPFAPA